MKIGPLRWALVFAPVIFAVIPIVVVLLSHSSVAPGGSVAIYNSKDVAALSPQGQAGASHSAVIHSGSQSFLVTIDG